MGEQTVTCPGCGATATGWRALYERFYRLHRPEPCEGQVWPQCWRCAGCGFVFGDPYPGSIEAEPAEKLDKHVGAIVE